MTADSIRVLHCPDLVGGHAPQLARSERALGLRSRSVSFFASPFAYDCDEILCERPGRLGLEAARWRLLWRAATSCDVVHFNFGSPIFPAPQDRPLSGFGGAARIVRQMHRRYARAVAFRDVALLRRLGKAVFVTYQGDDARQSDYCRDHFAISPVGEVDAAYYPAGSDDGKRRQIAMFDRHADGIYALNPDLLHVLPRRAQFLPYAHIDLDEWGPPEGFSAGARPLVVHAPSHRGVKGTRFVLEAVQRIRGAGVAFDFVLVEGVPRAEARRICERADLVVDQLLAGWYGGLAVEAMALGKPVIAYLRTEDLAYIPGGMREQLPLIQATPQSIFGVLREWLTVRRPDLPEVGMRSRQFVERWHDPLAIARRTKSDYERALLARRAPRKSRDTGSTAA